MARLRFVQITKSEYDGMLAAGVDPAKLRLTPRGGRRMAHLYEADAVALRAYYETRYPDDDATEKETF